MGIALTYCNRRAENNGMAIASNRTLESAIAIASSLRKTDKNRRKKEKDFSSIGIDGGADIWTIDVDGKQNASRKHKETNHARFYRMRIV